MHYIALINPANMPTWPSSSEECVREGGRVALVSHRVATIYSTSLIRSGVYSNDVASLLRREVYLMAKMTELLPVGYSCIPSHNIVKLEHEAMAHLVRPWKADRRRRGVLTPVGLAAVPLYLPPRNYTDDKGQQRTYPASRAIAAARLGLSTLNAEYETAG